MNKTRNKSSKTAETVRQKEVVKMFSNKEWTLNGLKILPRKLDATGNVERRLSSVPDVIDSVQDMVLSQENKPQMRSSQRQLMEYISHMHCEHDCFASSFNAARLL